MNRFWVLAVLLLLVPGTARGQSLLGSAGLGLPTEAQDTRARALGGITLGTSTPGVIPGEPTAALDLLFPTVVFTMQPSWGEFTLDGDTGDYQGTRFPLVGVAYPVGVRGVITATLASTFDQRWKVTREGTAEIGGEVIPTTDEFESEGGVSRFEVGYGRRVSADLAVGMSVGLHRGQVTRTFVRQFDTAAVNNPIAAFINGGRWNYFGPTVSVDARWDPVDVLRLGARVQWGGTLEAEPGDDTEGARRELDLPLEFGAGATLLLSPTLTVNAGVETANWAELGDADFNATANGRTTSFGGGLEWSGLGFWAGALPLRLGYRRAELPFSLDGAGATETTVGGGLGVVMSQAQGLPLVTLDFSWEYGDRESDASR